MSYAGERIKSDAIIDFATLTGACMVALGEDIAGLFCNDTNLTDQLKNSAKDAGEKIWELPLEEDYKNLLKSHVADIKNIGGKYGGAITGALFIGAFVPEHTPWAHLDIAGPSFAEKDTPLCPHGGTGFGIRTVIEYLMNISA
jgi:leucyl aminopeptidase